MNLEEKIKAFLDANPPSSLYYHEIGWWIALHVLRLAILNGARTRESVKGTLTRWKRVYNHASFIQKAITVCLESEPTTDQATSASIETATPDKKPSNGGAGAQRAGSTLTEARTTTAKTRRGKKSARVIT